MDVLVHTAGGIVQSHRLIRQMMSSGRASSISIW
jgi:hypothetical protein